VRISVFGCGYLGAVHAACMASLGHEVVGVDVVEEQVASLAAGRPPFHEPGLEQKLGEALATGRLEFTTDPSRAADAVVHFICVGTPQKKNENAADLSYVRSATETILGLLKPGDVVVGKSTVPVGTAETIADRIEEREPAAELVWNPEFLREGHAVEDTLRPDRLVYGVRPGDGAARASRVLDEVYAAALADGVPKVETDLATAQLVKVAANSFLATKISFINAMAEVCEATGADVTQLADAIGYDARIGRRFLNAGLGFGGGCLPKDIRAFIARAGELGADQAVSFLRDVDEINLRRRARTLELGLDLLDGSYRGTRVAVLGAAFKPNSDDVRGSPALDVAAAVGRRGATVLIYDPEANESARRIHPELSYAVSLDEAVADADLVMLLTEWQEFRSMDAHTVGKLVAQRNLVDGRNVLDPVTWRAAGWHYRALGRP